MLDRYNRRKEPRGKNSRNFIEVKLLEKCLMLALLHGLAAWGMILD